MVEEKACARCKLQKPINAFYPAPKLSTGLSSWCKDCSRLYAKNWKKRNPDKWRWKNPIALETRRARQKRSILELSDSYVAAKLNIPVASANPDLIDAKRIQMMISRLLKENK
jgi:hypothetical protein